MLDAKIRASWDAVMKPVGRSLARTHISPNAVTLLGLGVQIVVAVEIVANKLPVAGVLMIVSALLDALDGAVAKARGMTSRFGALLDSSVDRLSDALVFIPVAWLYGVSPHAAQAGREWVAALALVAMVASFLVSYVKARAEGLGLNCNVGIVERAERLMLMIVALLFEVLLPSVLTLLALLSIVTFLQRLLYVRARASGGP